MTSTISYDDIRAKTRELFRGEGRAMLFPCFAVWAFSMLSDVLMRAVGMALPQTGDDAGFVTTFLSIGANLGAAILEYGLAICALRLALGLEIDQRTILLAFRDPFRSVLALIGMGLLVIAFSILLIVPGVAAYVMLYPTLFILAGSRETGIFEAYGRSMAVTKGSRWTLFRLILIYEGPAVITAMLLAIAGTRLFNDAADAPYLVLANALATLLVSLILIPRLQISTALYYVEALSLAGASSGTPVWTESPGRTE